MEADGWVTVEVVEQEGRPDKRVHTPSPEGRRVLADWLATPMPMEAFRSEVAVKLRGASYGDRATLTRTSSTSAPTTPPAGALREARAREFPDTASLDEAGLDQWLVLRGGLRMERFWIDWITDYLQAHEADRAHRMTHPTYPHLLEPLTLGAGPDALTLRNRVVMGSMHTGLEDHPWDIGKLATFFAERARGGVGLIITGGYAPTKRGWLKPFASEMTNRLHAMRHERVTAAVHDAGGAIAMQMLHAGRYGYHPFSRAPRTRSRRSRPSSRARCRRRRSTTPRRLRQEHRAGAQGRLRRGRDHGLRGLPDQPVPRRPHQRPHRPVGRLGRQPDALPRRDRTPLARAGRRRLPDHLPDLAARPRRGRPDLGRDRRAGAAPAGRGRHRLQHRHRLARGPGPDDHHAGPARRLAVDTARLKGVVDVPVCASNRINTPEIAEEILAAGGADLISMARPFLADPEFVAKARPIAPTRSTPASPATRPASTTSSSTRAPPAWSTRAPAARRSSSSCRRAQAAVAVVGAGPAGLAAAVSAAERGFTVTLFEEPPEIGGQFRLAMQIPGKEEFAETLRYYTRRLEVLGVDVRLSTTAAADDLAGFDDIVIATGVEPRMPAFPGIDHPNVVSYADVLSGEVVPGRAGRGHRRGRHRLRRQPLPHPRREEDLDDWMAHWGVGDPALTAAA